MEGVRGSIPLSSTRISVNTARERLAGGFAPLHGAGSRYLGAMGNPGFDEVLAAAKLGAHWALEILYRDLAPSVIGWLRSQGHDDADDIASEVFVGVVRDIRRFEGDQARFRTWVFALAHHRLIDARRRQARRPLTYVDPQELHGSSNGSHDVEATVMDALDPGALLGLLDRLSDDQRTVITLRVVAGLSLAETAMATNRSVGAVKALQHRGLASLARHYGEISTEKSRPHP